MEGDIIVLQELFVFEQHGLDQRGKISGQFKSTGIRPKCMNQLEVEGITLPAVMFADARF